jgi:hypothetical protein
MRFSITALFAFAAAVVAQNPTEGFDVITKPTQGEKVPAGSTYDIVWQPSAAHPGSITIGLLGGASPQTLTVVDTIAKGVDASTGTYSWSVPSTLGKLATYGIIITLESDTKIFQYGFPFKIVGGTSSSTSTGTASGSATATASETETASETSTKSSTKTKATSTTVTSTSFSVPSSTIVSSTIRGNLSTTAGHLTTITSSVIVTAPTSTKSSSTAVVTNGVASLAAGSFAMLGGVAMAILAL